MVSTRTASTALIVGGVALFVLALAVSAALAPTIGAAGDDGDDVRRTLVGSQGGGAGLHEDGSVYLLSGTEEAWRQPGAASNFDVTMLDNGSVLAAFMDTGYDDCGPYDPPCTRTGFRIVDPDPDPEVVHEYSFPVRTGQNSEVHDVEPLPGGGYVLADMEHERIVTVEGGEITWQWNASSHYEAPEDPTREDWLHINDVDRIGEDRYLVSVRNANQLLVVERGEGVVEVINEDKNPDVLNRQHNPQWLGDGTVLVADSENDRIVELHRTDAGEWEVAWQLHSAEGVDFAWPRDADRLSNGNTLVTDSANQRLVEVDRDGEVVWSYGTDRIPYEAERLPEGETVGGDAYGAPDGEADAPDGDRAERRDVPVLSTALQILRTSVPLPFWLSEIHLFVALVSLGMVGSGCAIRLRLRFGR
ncbi:arylsulfotransferase family protein [Halegenticoccus tardaugens]|uniref:arylsulfotransferase family protein n=1 Tax=Halegenticoccus tardaugens TaxID=2071624 RepID=UPI00100B6AAC|nr:arylsulfotransferase family protein [Halegenticoccus tardaugens]